jgi:integrase
MGYSLKLKMDNYDPKKNEERAIYFQVIINRKKKRLGLQISWPPNRFSMIDGCLPRYKNDPDVDTYNIVIGNARTKANNIRKKYMREDKQLTMEAFLKEFKSNLDQNDFIKYFDQKSYARWNSREISDATYDKEKVVLNKLSKFQTSIPFNSFTSKWATEFDSFLKKKPYENDDNTRWGNHKIVQTYLNMARDDDKIPFDNPYARFTNKPVEGKWGPLTLDQMKTLLEKYLEWKDKPLPLLPRKNGVYQKDERPGLTGAEVIVLRKFLFSCNSALRISDLQQLDEDKFINGEMSITPHKTERFGTTIKSVPLNDIAKMMIEDEIADVRKERIKRDTLLRIFERYGDQACNRLLKRIANKAKIDLNLHNHVGRYTYASLLDQAGANHTSMMKLMGIRKRETLEKYVKTNKGVMAADIEKMNALVSQNPTKEATIS